MLDCGANVFCTNVETVKQLGREIKKYVKPIIIDFGGINKVECKYYSNFGKILGEVAVFENMPKTLEPIVPVLNFGFATIIIKGCAYVISKGGKIITQAQQQNDGLFYFKLHDLVFSKSIINKIIKR